MSDDQQVLFGNNDSRLEGGSNKAENQPLGSEGNDEQPLQVREGMYILTNKKSRSSIDLAFGVALIKTTVTCNIQ